MTQERQVSASEARWAPPESQVGMASGSLVGTGSTVVGPFREGWGIRVTFNYKVPDPGFLSHLKCPLLDLLGQ